ncbi:hypothetical protein HQ520_07550 [bacterium]|nr:hypothetical protein [bacterium]
MKEELPNIVYFDDDLESVLLLSSDRKRLVLSIGAEGLANPVYLATGGPNCLVYREIVHSLDERHWELVTYDLEQGTVKCRISYSENRVPCCFGLSDDSTTLAVVVVTSEGDRRETTVELRSAATGAVQHHAVVPYPDVTARVSWSPDKRLIAIGVVTVKRSAFKRETTRDIVVLSASDMETVARFQGRSPSFTPDGDLSFRHGNEWRSFSMTTGRTAALDFPMEGDITGPLLWLDNESGLAFRRETEGGGTWYLFSVPNEIYPLRCIPSTVAEMELCVLKD